MSQNGTRSCSLGHPQSLALIGQRLSALPQEGCLIGPHRKAVSLVRAVGTPAALRQGFQAPTHFSSSYRALPFLPSAQSCQPEGIRTELGRVTALSSAGKERRAWNTGGRWWNTGSGGACFVRAPPRPPASPPISPPPPLPPPPLACPTKVPCTPPAPRRPSFGPFLTSPQWARLLWELLCWPRPRPPPLSGGPCWPRLLRHLLRGPRPH